MKKTHPRSMILSVDIIVNVWLIGGKSWESVIQAEAYRVTGDEGEGSQQTQLPQFYYKYRYTDTRFAQIISLQVVLGPWWSSATGTPRASPCCSD